MIRHDHLDTERGALNIGDVFKFQPGGPGTAWQSYAFHGHLVHPAGGEWVTCYGGDPNPKGARAWRSFDVDRIRKGAVRERLATARRKAA